jgi:hypothetical protein
MLPSRTGNIGAVWIILKNPKLPVLSDNITQRAQVRMSKVLLGQCLFVY